MECLDQGYDGQSRDSNHEDSVKDHGYNKVEPLHVELFVEGYRVVLVVGGVVF